MIRIERFPYTPELTQIEKKLLIEIICDEQSKMIINNHTSYESDRYKMLEHIKVKIKNMEGINESKTYDNWWCEKFL